MLQMIKVFLGRLDVFASDECRLINLDDCTVLQIDCKLRGNFRGSVC